MNDKLRNKLTEQQEQVRNIAKSLISKTIDDASVFQLNGYSTKCFEWQIHGVKQLADAITKEIEAEKQKKGRTE